MAKVMVFIDGTWLYSNQKNLSEAYGGKFQIDYGKLPISVGDIVGEFLGGDIDIVRTHLFGSNAKNYLPIDRELVLKRKDFFDILKEEYYYEVEIYDIDYQHRRLRKDDRASDDDFKTQEKCVDIALASAMLYYAAIPNAYDIAVLIAGDKDFIPAIKQVRRLGKRVAIASIRKSCPAEFKDVSDKMNLRDFDLIWLDDILHKIELRISKRQVECMSPYHKGPKMVYTEEFIRKGRPYYCLNCRDEFKKQRTTFSPDDYYEEEFEAELAIGDEHFGEIKRLMGHFGIITTKDGDFYFGADDMSANFLFEDLKENATVKFLIAKLPKANGSGKEANGNATEVRSV